MCLVHLVPTEGTEWVPRLAHLFEGKPAASFFILAGCSWAIQQGRVQTGAKYYGYVLRRSVALIILGLLLFRFVWQTEVLSALGLAFLLSAPLLALGRRWVVVSLVLVLALTPWLTHLWSGMIDGDYLESGAPILTWASAFRLAIFDGNYPLVPWIGFVFMGMLIAKASASQRIAVGSVGTVLGLCVWLVIKFGTLPDTLDWRVEWIPTTLPFFIVCGGLALGCLGFVTWLEQRCSSTSVWSRLQGIGRLSLSHYVGHLILVILPLRLRWPDEQWPRDAGLLAFGLYFLFAWIISSWWLRMYAKGPLETALAWIAGPTGKKHG